MCVLMYHVTWGLTIAWLHTYLKVSRETLTSGKGRGDVYWIDLCTPSLSKFIPHPEMLKGQFTHDTTCCKQSI